jgi:hypothetical protein
MSDYPTTEDPLKTLFLNSSQGVREGFIEWLVKRYPDYLCVQIRRCTEVKCEEKRQ